MMVDIADCMAQARDTFTEPVIRYQYTIAKYTVRITLTSCVAWN